MSKAFTTEDDSEPKRNARMRWISGSPPGALNYLTIEGARRNEKEFTAIRHVEPERAAEIRSILDSVTTFQPSPDPLGQGCDCGKAR